MTERRAKTQQALDLIARYDDPRKLEIMQRNALAEGNEEVAHAAKLKLFSVKPSAENGTLEHDVWQSIYALEHELKIERGKTVLLSRTRQKIARDGEVQTIADLVRKPPSEGFQMLVERNMPQLSFEAVALRHPYKFDDDILSAADRRLREYGYDPALLILARAPDRTPMKGDELPS